MNITKHRIDDCLTITLEGRLDTTNANELEEVLKTSLTGVTELVFELGGLEYMSSAGLRLMLSAQKTMNKQGKMVIRHATELVKSVFTITGMDEIMTLED